MLLGCSIILMSGCASSSLVNKWHDSSFQSPPLTKMLVISVRKDEIKRRIWEDAFTGELEKHGVTATPSYRLFPDSIPDTDQVVKTMQSNSFDGVLVVRRLPTETNINVVEGYVSTEQDVHYSSYWQQYFTYYSEVSHPGYIDTQKVALRTIDVTTAGKNGRLIWSATSRTPEPGSVAAMQSGIARLVIAELAQFKIISPGK